MNDPRTWTTEWESTVGAVGRMGRGRQKGKNWDNCNRRTIKNDEKKQTYVSQLSYPFLSYIGSRKAYVSDWQEVQVCRGGLRI